jgi:TonB family protein
MTALVLSTIVKTSLILCVALAAIAMLRRQSAALRHSVLAAALACAATVPLLTFVVPSWQIPQRIAEPQARVATFERFIAPAPIATGNKLEMERQIFVRVRHAEDDAPAGSMRAWIDLLRQRAERIARSSLLLPIWIVGGLANVAILLAGLGRLSWLAARATRVANGPLVDLTEHIRNEFAITRPVVLLSSHHPTLLVTWGLWRPKIILPSTSRVWKDERMHVVLSHELAHVRRADWAVQMAAELLRSIYWFNPLVWMACARLRQESEQACDDAVLARGVDGSQYATHLLDVARAFSSERRIWSPAPAIARPSNLRKRVRALLNVRANRSPVTRSGAAIAIVGLLAVTVPIAGFGPPPQDPSNPTAALSGFIFDPLGGVVPDVPLYLSNVETRVQKKGATDNAGHFEFDKLPPGTYRLSAAIGFVPPATVTLAAGDRVQHNITMRLGGVQGRIGICADCPRVVAPYAMPESLAKELARDDELIRNQPVVGPRGMGDGFPLPMQQLRDLAYPQHLRDARIEGTVVVEGRIGTDGFPTGLRVVSAGHPELAKAAVAALKELQWEPARIRGVAVEVPLSLTIEYKLK